MRAAALPLDPRLGRTAAADRPQYGREESLHAMDLLTGIANANRAAERT